MARTKTKIKPGPKPKTVTEELPIEETQEIVVDVPGTQKFAIAVVSMKDKVVVTIRAGQGCETIRFFAGSDVPGKAAQKANALVKGGPGDPPEWPC